MRFDDTAIQKIIQGRRVVGRTFFPGTRDEIGVQLLTEREIDQARFAAQDYLEGRSKSYDMDLERFVRIDPESFDREHQRQIIYAAFVDIDDADLPPEKRAKFFPDVHAVRTLDSVLTQQLWEAYLDYQDAINPRINLTAKEVEELAASLKDGPISEAVLAPFERSTLTSLVRTLAKQRSISPTGKSSTSPTS